MADDVTLNAGSGGDVIAADDISSVKFQRVKLTLGADGVNDGDISSTNPIPGIHASLQSSNNTTTTPLGISATYTGTGEQNDYPEVMVSCFADVTGTLYFDFSVNGTDWRTFPTAGFAVAANTHEIHTAVKGPRYFRVRYVNDGTGQTTFQLYTYYGTFQKLNAPLNQALASDSDALTTKSVISAETPGGSFTNVGATAGGNLKIAIEEFVDQPPDLNSGAAGAGTLRVTLATDDTPKVHGTVAHDGVDADNPVKIGGKASSSAPAAVADGDRVNAAFTLQGASHVNLRDGSGTEWTTGNPFPVIIEDISPSGIAVQGDVNHDGADSGNPIKVGGKAATTLPTAVADADRVNAVYTTQGAATVAGVDGTTPRGIAVNASGQLEVDIAAQQGSALTVDGSAVTQPISAVSLPLPTGAATSANQPPVVTDGSAAGTQGNHLLGTDGTNAQIISTNTSGHVNIADGGNVITVDGTVTADAGTGPWPVTDNGGALTVDWNGTAPPIGSGVEATALRVTVANDSTGVLSVDDNGASLTVDGTGLGVVGNAAHDAAVSGNPVLIAGEARTTTPTAVANGDVVRFQCDKAGRQIVRGAPRELITQNNITLTNTTAETTLLAAGGAGVYRDVTRIIFSNTSSTKTRVDIRDSTAGTVRLSMSLAADGGGAVLDFGTIPMTQTSVNTAWTAQCGTAVTDVRVFVQAVAAN